MGQPHIPPPTPPHDTVDDISEDSFPASDAPSFTPVTGSKPEKIDREQVRRAQRDRAVAPPSDARNDEESNNEH
jgi:hypothetical protein